MKFEDVVGASSLIDLIITEPQSIKGEPTRQICLEIFIQYMVLANLGNSPWVGYSEET